MSKFLHVFSDSPYAISFIRFIERNFNFDEHQFIILSLGKSSKYIEEYKNYGNCNITDNKNLYFNYKQLFKSSKQIIIHQLNKPSLMLSLLIMYRDAFDKIVWVLWGGDVYIKKANPLAFKNKLLLKLRAIAISKIPLMVAYIKGDYDYVIEHNKTKADFIKADYPSFISKEQIEQFEEVSFNKKTKVIIVGNSADPSNRHEEIYRSLSRFKREDILVMSLLSYGGDENYIKNVKATGEKIFGCKFKAVENYMDFNKYLNFIASSDICIFNHNRQQGLGNLKVFFALRKKVFIKKVTTPFEYFKNIGLAVQATEDIDRLDFDQFCFQSSEVSQKNKSIMINEIDESTIVEDWSQVFNKASI